MHTYNYYLRKNKLILFMYKYIPCVHEGDLSVEAIRNALKWT